MPTTSTAPRVEAAPGGMKKLFRRWKSFGGSFLFVSISLHLLFGVGATVFIVQRIAAKRQLAFQGGPPAPTKSQRSVEHKVQVQKQKQQSSAPAPPKRIATTGLAKVSLPELPTIATASTSLTATKLSGMGGTGSFGMGPGTLGAGTGSAGGGGGVPMFGLREPTGGGLRGTFYDAKQTPNGQPTEMAITDAEPPGVANNLPANAAYTKLSAQFIKGGLNEGLLSRFFRGPSPLFATQVFIPQIDANKGPEAFNLSEKVKPKRWLVVYRGSVTPPESGNYRFVGSADDIIAVRFNGRIVLDGSLNNASGLRPKTKYLFTDRSAVYEGDPCGVTAGTSYPIEIVIGEQPGGSFWAFLLLEKIGVTYEKSAKGYPRFPIFKMAPSGPPRPGTAPEISADTSWSVWKGVSAANPNPGGSLLEQMRKN